MQGLLTEYLRLRERGPFSRSFELQGFESALRDGMVGEVTKHVAAARSSVTLTSSALSPAAAAALVDAVPAGVRTVSLAFFFAVKENSHLVTAAMERMVRRCAATLEELELVCEAAGEDEGLLGALGTLPVLSKLVLLTQFAQARCRALRLPPLRSLWLGTCTLLFGADATAAVLGALASPQDSLEELRLTLMPGAPDDQPAFFEQMGAALGRLHRLQQLVYFGGLPSLPESRALLLPVLRPERLTELTLCTRYFHLDCLKGLPEAPPRLPNLRLFCLVIARSFRRSDFDRLMQMLNPEALRVLAIDAEDSNKPNLFTPERVRALQRFRLLEALMLRQDTHESVLSLLHGLEPFGQLQRLCLIVNVRRDPYRETEMRPFVLPQRLTSLWLLQCPDEVIGLFQGLEQLHELALEGGITAERLSLLRGCSALRLLQVDEADGSAAQCTRIVDWAAAAKVREVRLRVRGDDAMEPQQLAAAAARGVRLRASPPESDKEMLPVVRFAGLDTGHGFLALLAALGAGDGRAEAEEGSGCEEEEDSDPDMDGVPLWTIFGRMGQRAVALRTLRRADREAEAARRVARLRAVVEQAQMAALVGLRYGLPKDLRRMLFRIVVSSLD